MISAYEAAQIEKLERDQSTYEFQKIKALEKQLAEVTAMNNTLERVCEGLSQDAMDGGFTVKGLQEYAKSLETQLAEVSAERDAATLRAEKAERYRYAYEKELSELKQELCETRSAELSGLADYEQLEAKLDNGIRVYAVEHYGSYTANTHGKHNATLIPDDGVKL